MSSKWLFRSTPDGNDRMPEFLNNNFIGIGFTQTGDLSGLKREDIKQLLSNPPHNLKSLELGNAYATVDIFVNQIQIGDLLLVPHNEDIYFAEVTSDYKYDASKIQDGYPHQREVKWLNGPILRTTLPKDLRSSLRVQRTIANLDKYSTIIKNLSQGKGNNNINTVNDNVIEVHFPIHIDVTVKISIPKDITKESQNGVSIVTTVCNKV